MQQAPAGTALRLRGLAGPFSGCRLPQPQLSSPPPPPPSLQPALVPSSPYPRRHGRLAPSPRALAALPGRAASRGKASAQRDAGPQPPPVIFASSQHGVCRARAGDAAGERRSPPPLLPPSRAAAPRHHGACRRPGGVARRRGPAPPRPASQRPLLGLRVIPKRAVLWTKGLL